MKDSIVVNGVPVVMSLHLVTEQGEGLKGSRLLASCNTMQELTDAINDAINEGVPDFWQLEVDFQDKPESVGLTTYHWSCIGCDKCGSSGNGESWI